MRDKGQGFIKLLAYLEPGYKVPSSKHITVLWEEKALRDLEQLDIGGAYNDKRSN